MKYFSLILFVLFLIPSAGLAQSNSSGGFSISHAYQAGTVLVGFNSNVSNLQVRKNILNNNLNIKKEVGVKTFVVKTSDVESSILKIKKISGVRYAEPNYIVKATVVPNDPYYPQLWGMEKISAPTAWNTTTGSNNVVVGVVDTGINYNHEDLSANVWSNPGVNNCPAGTHGFNAVNQTCNPADDHFHGTHVSGTIGAVGNNNKGVVGVNWTTSIMGLKFLDASGSGTNEGAIEAIDWAIRAKQAGVNVRVLSNSWGGGGFSQALLDEIRLAYSNDILFVAAAGNSNVNVDSTSFYPCAYDSPNVICVAASDQNDNRASFSNYGATSVDLAAPGVDTFSTDLANTGYRYASGTSMATPHVSGAAALVLSVCDEDVASLKQTLLQSVDVLPNWNGVVVSSGRLNLSKLFDNCIVLPPSPNLVHDNTVITDSDSNGILEPGETIQIKERVKNIGNLSATGILSTVSSTESQISIVQGSSSYPDIASGATATNDNNFIVTASSSLPCGDKAAFHLEFSSDQGNMNTLFYVSKKTCPLPKITSFSPTQGQVGTVVNITGTSLLTTKSVAFSGWPATNVNVISDTQVSATYPRYNNDNFGPPDGKVSVTTSSGTAISTSNFHGLPPPGWFDVTYKQTGRFKTTTACGTTVYGPITFTNRTPQEETINLTFRPWDNMFSGTYSINPLIVPAFSAKSSTLTISYCNIVKNGLNWFIVDGSTPQHQPWPGWYIYLNVK
jgi:subtilisin family serine protease